jgi:hypothetical protein
MLPFPFDRTFPSPLAELHRLPFDYDGGDGIDFEPFEQFMSAKDNADWIRAWTGNDEMTGAEYRIFGQDGSGGYCGFWLVRERQPILAQPIVFMGSEGEMGVVATSFADYVWLLAGGLGPAEAVEDRGARPSANAAFTAFAKKHAPESKKSPAKVLAAARAEYPDFAERVWALCR